MKYDVASHLLPLQGVENARDLGNYPVAGNHITKKEVFFRSDSTSNFTTADIRLMQEKNLGLVVDLRSEMETHRAPSVFTHMDGIRYENVRMLDDLNSGRSSETLPPSMGAVYIHLLDSAKESFARVFRAFSDTIETGKSCLFHCAVGKDRTGTTAMLLLDLVRADDDLIIADYAATYDFMKPVFDKQMAAYKAKGYDVPEYMMRSDASNMETTLAYLRSTYGNAKEYLHECGVLEREIETIVDSFVI